MNRDRDEQVLNQDAMDDPIGSMLKQFTPEELRSGIVERAEREPVSSLSFDEVREAFAEALLQDSLAALLQSARGSAQLSLADVAERLNVSRGRIHQLEQDGANLQIATLARLADALGYDVRVTFIARDEGRPPLSAPLR